MIKSILFISHDATRTGAPILLLNLIKLIVHEKIFDVSILLKRGGILEKEFEKYCPVIKIDYNSPGRRFYKRGIRGKRKLIKFVQSFDIVISNTITNGDIDVILNTHPRVCTYVHELSEGIDFFTKKEFLQNVIKHTKYFIYPSKAVKINLMNQLGVSEEKLAYLPYYIPDNFDEKEKLRFEIRSKLGIAPNEILITGMGTGDWRKGPDLFLQSMLFAYQRNSNIRTLWVGMSKLGIDFRRFMYDVRLSKFEEGLIVLDSVDIPSSYLFASDIFFLSSREDPYPLVVLEAAMASLPIICFEGSGGSNEFLDSAGFIIPYLRTDLAADKIIELSLSQNLMQKMAEKGREKYLKLHNNDYVLNYFKRIMDAALN